MLKCLRRLLRRSLNYRDRCQAAGVRGGNKMQKGIYNGLREKWNRLPHWAREWIESIVVAALLALVIRTFLFQAFKIPSGSMRMTLLEGDRLMVNKLRYGPLVPFTKQRIPGFSKPKRGDIIVFIYPEDPKRDFIKRLIAFGGETVEIRDGTIYIDDKPVDEPRIKDRYYYNAGSYAGEGEVVRVPEGQVFVLGDNSANSRDSRYWGFVPEDNIVGRAELLYWPFNRLRLLASY